MIIGIPKERERLEHRVGLTPYAASHLVGAGATVLVERDAGGDAHFADDDYKRAGAEIVYTAEDVYKRAGLICQVSVIGPRETDMLESGAVICGFQHLAVAPKDVVQRLCRAEATILGYEIVEDERGERPILLSTSDLAGQIGIHEAGHLLQIQSGGRGIILGNTPGVPPATVLILGAGAVGTSAARHAMGNGAHVIVLDDDDRKLQRLFHALGGGVVTAMAEPSILARYVAFADVIIGAVLIPGGRAPFLVTEAMVRSMKPGSVIVDISIDQGGCIETSRPTTLDSPTFIVHGVVHYCVPNMTSSVARTASRTLTLAALPYLLRILAHGLDRALLEDAGLAAGIYLYRGRPVHEAVARLAGVPNASLADLLRGRS